MHQRTENTRTRAPQGRWLCAAVLLLPVALLLCGRQWARSSWVGVWPYRVGALGQLAGLGPCATLQGDTVILHLRPGGCGPFVPAVRVPDDIPSGEPTLRLPRYPGAIATDRRTSMPLSSPLDGYLKGASVALLVPTADPSSVANWYAARLTSRGYMASSSGSGVDPTLPISGTVTVQGFSWPGQYERTIQVGVEPVVTGALLLLVAQIPAAPPRPAASIIPAGASSLTIAFGSRYDPAQARLWRTGPGGSGDAQPWVRTIRDQSIVARLARIVDAMPVQTGLSGAVIDPRIATLTSQPHTAC